MKGQHENNPEVEKQVEEQVEEYIKDDDEGSKAVVIAVSEEAPAPNSNPAVAPVPIKPLVQTLIAQGENGGPKVQTNWIGWAGSLQPQ